MEAPLRLPRPREEKTTGMSAQELELAVLYAYNPPGVGQEAASVKAQVKEKPRAKKDNSN